MFIGGYWVTVMWFKVIHIKDISWVFFPATYGTVTWRVKVRLGFDTLYRDISRETSAGFLCVFLFPPILEKGKPGEMYLKETHGFVSQLATSWPPYYCNSVIQQHVPFEKHNSGVPQGDRIIKRTQMPLLVASLYPPMVGSKLFYTPIYPFLVG